MDTVNITVDIKPRLRMYLLMFTGKIIGLFNSEVGIDYVVNKLTNKTLHKYMKFTYKNR